MGTDRALCLKNDFSIQVQKMPARTASLPKSFERLSVMSHCTLYLAQLRSDRARPLVARMAIEPSAGGRGLVRVTRKEFVDRSTRELIQLVRMERPKRLE
jgi:hypothetical protein